MELSDVDHTAGNKVAGRSVADREHVNHKEGMKEQRPRTVAQWVVDGKTIVKLASVPVELQRLRVSGRKRERWEGQDRDFGNMEGNLGDKRSNRR